MPTPCAKNVVDKHPEVPLNKAELLVNQIKNLAVQLAKTNGGNFDEAFEQVKQSLTLRDRLNAANSKRAVLKDAIAQNNLVDFALKFRTVGEGLKTKLLGGKSNTEGARFSIYSQILDLYHGYVGRLTHELEELGAFRAFRRNEVSEQVYYEMAELVEGGTPGSTGSKDAMNIARVWNKLNREMNALINKEGGNIGDLPGYVVMQTHDIAKIRAAGQNKTEAFTTWRNFIEPKLNEELTFLGRDKDMFLKNVFDALYSGTHGVMGVEGSGIGHHAMSQKFGQERVLHFKGPKEAFDYNQRFGSRDLKEQILTDISSKARSIAMMRELGVNTEENLISAVRKLKEIVRSREDAILQTDSLKIDELIAAYRQVAGINDIPTNPSLARFGANTRAIIQMAKMGGVAITNLFTDRAFLQSEMISQGVSNLNTLGKQLKSFAKRTGDEKKTLRLMGIGIDGLLGNTLSRYSATGPMSKWIDKAQKSFFDWNLSNLTTDAAKSAAAEIMAGHLGDHATMVFKDLPEELINVLRKFEIGDKEWNLIRSTAYEHSSWGTVVTPDQLEKLSDAQIATLHKGEKAPSPEMLSRYRDTLQAKLRTYFIDRTNAAIPTAGAEEQLLLNFGTRPGTPAGEAIRLLALFKSFPVTIANKILAREVYGRGNETIGKWIMNDHQGKFQVAQLIAMTTIAGYVGMTIRDILRGRTPRELIVDGKINWDVLSDAAVNGGGLGIMGELIARDYEQGMGSFLEAASGPAFSTLNSLMNIKTHATEGETFAPQLGRLAIDNIPLINLFYIRPILNYYVLWNLQEMMSPGSLERVERTARQNAQQDFFVVPSETVTWGR